MSSDWGSNPFEENDANPFEDESVTSATAQSGEKNKKKKSKKSKKGSSARPPAYNEDDMFGSSENTVARGGDPYGSDQGRFAASVEEADLRQREADLRAREERLVQREEMADELVRKNTKNYPPFPKWFCIRPFVYHNIKEEIPETFRKWQRFNFLHFHIYVGLLCLNIIATGVQLDLPANHPRVSSQEYITSFIVSIVYLVFFPPLTYYTVYGMLYNAVRNASGLRMVLHLAFMLVHIGWSTWMCSGMYNSGGGGFIGAGDFRGLPPTEGHSYATLSAMLYVMAILWMLDALASIFLWLMTFRFWRSGALKFSDAREEAVKEAASNKTIREGAFTAAKAGASAAASDGW